MQSFKVYFKNIKALKYFEIKNVIKLLNKVKFFFKAYNQNIGD